MPEPTGAALWQALRRRWLLAVSLGLLGAALAAGAIWFGLPAKYTAQALIHISPRTQKGVFTGESEYQSSEEFAAYLRSQATLVKSNAVLHAALLKPEVAGLAELGEHADPLDWLQRDLQTDVTAGPEFVRVTLSGEHPQDVAVILNTVVKTYLTEATKKERELQKSRIEQLQASFRNYQEDLRKKRSELKGLEETIGSVDLTTLTARHQAAANNLNQAETKLLEARMDLEKTKAELKMRQGEAQKPPVVSVTEEAVGEYLRQDPVAQSLQARLAQVQDEIGQYESRLKPGEGSQFLAEPHQRRKAILDALVARRQAVRPQVEEYLQNKGANERAAEIARLEREVAGHQAKVNIVEEAKKHQDKLVQQLASKIRQPDQPTADLEALRDDVQQADTTLKKVADQLQLMKVEPTLPARATLDDPAEPPRARNMQLQAKLAGGAAFGIFGLIVLIVTWREFRTRRIYAVDDVVQGLGLSLIGTLPLLPARGRPLLPSANGKESTSLGQLAESVDAIRTLLLHAAGDKAPRVVMVTSAVGGEGKTSLASQLAHSLARAWRKTLLLDGDLRNPAVHRQFEVPLEPGFSEVLRGEAELDQVIQPTAMSRLWVVPAGQVDAHSLQALAQKEVHQLFDRLKDQYDFIIVDSSPVLPVADALSLAQNMDGVILSVLRDVSRMPAVHAAYQRLAKLNVPVLGTVVIGAPNDLGSLGYSYPTRPVR
jgi:capsular exopolysaccharide synthesis family protein